MRRRFAIHLLAALLLPGIAPAQPEIGMAFPPVSDALEQAFTLAALRDLGIRHIRIAENWTRRGLTPTPEDFAPLVRRIETLRAGGVSILLTVQSDGPRAACAARNRHGCRIDEDAPFEAYLGTLLQAVGGDIEAIQFGNEWDNQFPGSASQFLANHARFAAVVRAERPTLPIVLGGVTARAPYAALVCDGGMRPTLPGIDLGGHLAQFCQTQSQRNARTTAMVEQVLRQADYDIADLHLYDFPELWSPALAWMQARSRTNRIWVTEWGGPAPDIEPADAAYQASRLPAYFAAIDALPVARAYYFQLVDSRTANHAHSGLYAETGAAKPALAVFASWLSRTR